MRSASQSSRRKTVFVGTPANLRRASASGEDTSVDASFDCTCGSRSRHVTADPSEAVGKSCQEGKSLKTPRHGSDRMPKLGCGSQLRWKFVSTFPGSGAEEGKSNSPSCPRKERGDKERGSLCRSRLLLAHFPNALFQHVHGDIRFFFGYNQRGTKAD